MIKIKDITAYLESIAPLGLQESYDNCGLLVGNPSEEVKKILVTLDCTEPVVDEAVRNGCNLIIAHHPIIFGGIKKLNGSNYVERTLIAAIKHNIAIYAIHTNLDNWHKGVSHVIANRLGLQGQQVLMPMANQLIKLVTYVPTAHKESLLNALFEAGAGNIGNYKECSFSLEGEGTFMATQEANPFVGEKGSRHLEKESRVEVILPDWKKWEVLQAMRSAHPYEEVAYDLIKLENPQKLAGSGILGVLAEPMLEAAFLDFLKEKMETHCIRYTPFEGKIEKVAVCGGAGSFLIKQARKMGAQAFVTADVKYHEFFDAENQLLLADIGHFESEKFTKSLLSELILKKFPTFAVLLSEINTNPIKYYS